MIGFAALFMVLAVVVGIVSGVTFLPMLFQQRRQLSQHQPSSHELEELGRLRIEVGDLQSEMASLTERLDFTERLLSGRTETPPADPPSTD